MENIVAIYKCMKDCTSSPQPKSSGLRVGSALFCSFHEKAWASGIAVLGSGQEKGLFQEKACASGIAVLGSGQYKGLFQERALFQENESRIADVNTFLVFSINNKYDQTYFMAPIDPGNPASVVLARGMISFQLTPAQRPYVGQCAGGVYLFSSTPVRWPDNVNRDRLCLFYPPTNEQVHLPSAPHTGPFDIHRVYYYLGCTRADVYKVLACEMMNLGQGVVDCTLKIRTVRENGEWRIDNEVWRTLPHLDADVGVACRAFMFYPKSVEPCLQLEGALHWLSEVMGAIIVFDLETEEFRDIRLPLQGIHHNIVGRLFRFEGRLALMRVSEDIMVVNIWSLDYATEQWIRQPIDRRIIFDDLYMGFDWASEPLSNYFHDFVMMKEFVISADDIWINAYITATRVFRQVRVEPTTWVRDLDVPGRRDKTTYFSTYADGLLQ